MAEPRLRGRLGSPDRTQRFMMGLVLLALNMFGLLNDPKWPQWIALGIQIELITTALMGWCPLYWSMGTHSCPTGLHLSAEEE